MFTAAELIESLEARYRRRFPLHAQRPFGEFPPTWRLWFLAMHERMGAVRGAPAADFVAIFAKRPLAKTLGEKEVVGRTRALIRLFVRQQWGPALREERGLRRFAATVSALAHVCFLSLLVWLAIIAIEHAPKRDEAGEAIQVEFIGEGTPEETGGGPAQGDDEAQPPASASAEASPQDATQRDTPTEAATSAEAPVAEQTPETPPVAEASPPSETEPTPQPEEPAPPVAEQPLVVTEPRTPPDEAPVFALPPPRPRTPQTVQRALNEPQLNASAVEIEIREPQPPVRALERREVVRTPSTPELRESVAEIEIREPLPAVQARTPTPRTTQQPLRTPTLRSEPGEIAMREPKPAASPTPAPSPGAAAPSPRPSTAQTRPGNSPTSSGAAPAPSSTTGGRPAAPATGTRPTAGPGVGPAATPRPGGLPSPRRSDDWGDSTQNRPGNSTAGRTTGPGVFNPDGSIRMPSTTGQVGGGLPPGTITEDFEKIDRMGTWLKRPPTDYTPNRFERYFVPHESLLQEWVRRNIREVFMPIPGTKKRLVCKVSLLQAGGGCFIDDPNMRDQEAEARKPPDVPFKPGLQDDQSGLTKP